MSTRCAILLATFLAACAVEDADPSPTAGVWWACECAEECASDVETTWHVVCAGPDVEDVDPQTAEMTHECAVEKGARECSGWSCLCVCRATEEPCTP